ncbi:3-hydroxyisobutyrate dehydrogenase [Actinomadura hibisca]|uniref:3-hydroxyisobutyrate dehydrogenase n=1 Tax=Actinomadura hibisca TaxID=68565 RepID=UPI000830326A|nr:3-hydroxyisobutyrate dehydrogenase [Actinomadura hibisca]
MTTVAVVGLGNMGGPMATALVRAGHTVHGFDLAPEACQEATEAGVRVTGTLAEAVARAEAVITMLPAGRHVLDCYRGDSGVLVTAAPGTLLIDCSTIDVADARAVHRAAGEAGFTSLDAPVSGGVAGARAAALTFMAGGSPDAFARAEPLLAAMGHRIVHCGPEGAGQTAKICNNMILGASMIAVSEAFVLGERLGLSHQALFDVASAASGRCWALTGNCPVPGPVPGSPANNDYRPGFATALMAKDLRIAANALADTGVNGTLGAHAAALYAALAEGPNAERDFSSIVEDVRKRSRPHPPAGPGSLSRTTKETT